MCDVHRRLFIGRSLGAGIGACALGLGGVQPAWAQQPKAAPAPGSKWVCPPCGCPSDGEEFDKAGSCPSCGMVLIAKAPPGPASKWVCPPCGCASDGEEFDKAGSCPSCGMVLIAKAAPAAATAPAPSAPPPSPPQKAPKAGP